MLRRDPRRGAAPVTLGPRLNQTLGVQRRESQNHRRSWPDLLGQRDTQPFPFVSPMLMRGCDLKRPGDESELRSLASIDVNTMESAMVRMQDVQIVHTEFE